MLALPAVEARDVTAAHVPREEAADELRVLTSDPIPVGKHLVATCVEERLDAVVTRGRSPSDVVSTLVPRSFVPESIEEVVVAVADGPNSPFAVAIAARVRSVLDVPGRIVTVFRSEAEQVAAELRLSSYAGSHPRFSRNCFEAPNVKVLLDALSPGSLLVIGAPEGSWFQRQLLGPGPALIGGAPGPSIAVRSAPRRCFHLMRPAAGRAIAPQMRARDAWLVTRDPTVPVAEGGLLLGIARRDALELASPDASVADVMEDPVAVQTTEPATAAEQLSAFLDGGPIPVVGEKSELLGLIDLRKEDP
jgi:hypothetical protein